MSRFFETQKKKSQQQKNQDILKKKKFTQHIATTSGKKNCKSIHTSSSKMNKKVQEKEKKNYILQGHALLSEGIFQGSKKFIQFSLKPKILCLQKRNS